MVRTIKVKKHTRMGEIDVKSHTREIESRKASSGSNMPLISNEKQIQKFPNRIQIGRLIIQDLDIYNQIMKSNDELNKKQLNIEIPKVLEKYKYYGDLSIKERRNLILNNDTEEIIIGLSVCGNNISNELISFLDNKSKVDNIINEIINSGQEHIFYSEIFNYLKGYNGLPKQWIGRGIAYDYMARKLRINGVEVSS